MLYEHLYFHTFYILTVWVFTLFLTFYYFNLIYSPFEIFLPASAELRGTKVWAWLGRDE